MFIYLQTNIELFFILELPTI